ncbi:hypothetical protein TRICI_004669 [Trichomonascus ciferrii]|uniref:RFX-type winged-helix domain-containing protein n=1 Tax=Trichomonascus ciferrii TaxID=44093 RepID=A0A642V098_9ASCO|nr:hypothetical protein TRICI_004669 [Trichomonascus ciferrii]
MASPQPQPQNDGPIAISVMTPSINPHAFQSLTYRNSKAAMAQNTGVRGAEWMTRITMGMRSGIPSELDWALTALLQVSCNNPHMFELKYHGDLLSAILERILNRWYLEDYSEQLESLGSLALSDAQHKELQMILEALLILRNASLDPENGQLLAHDPRCREVIERGLNLPVAVDVFAEFRLYCLEMAESVCFHITPESAEDPLFVATLNAVSAGEDRGHVIPSLRALSRLLIRDEKNIVQDLPDAVLSQVCSYLLVDDDELVSAALDFLYQFTSHASNVARLLQPDLQGLCCKHLVRLITHRLREPEPDYIRLPRRTQKPVPVEPPRIPDDILEELLTYDEPDRATHWIRTSYEDHPEGEVTQISLWKAYEAQFEAHARQGRKLLPAVDFIKNVTSAFRNSAAMVVNLPDGQRKFIIKGIRPREYAIAPSVLKKRAEEKELEKEKKQHEKPHHQQDPNPEPPAFGVTAALVLQNIARSPDGKAMLEAKIPELMHAMLLNPTIPSYVHDLVDLLTASYPSDNRFGTF